MIAQQTNQNLETIKNNRDLVNKVLSELGSGFCVSIGRDIAGTDGGYNVTPVYNIKKTGINGSKRWVLGARTILQLCGYENDTSAPFGLFDLQIEGPFTENEQWYVKSNRGEPTDLIHYIEKRPDLITTKIRDILSQRGLEGLRSSMLVNDEKLIEDVLKGFGNNYFMRLGDTFFNKESYRTSQDSSPGAEHILPTVDMCLPGFVFPKRVFGLVSENYCGEKIKYFENYKKIVIPAQVRDIISQQGLTEINAQRKKSNKAA